jgi:polyisoprenoid-binding protein YceI
MTTIIPAGTWVIDPSHSEISFTARHLLVSKVRGSFEKFSATITVADEFTAIKGVTKSVTLALEVLGVNKDPYGNLKAGFSASAKVNRKDFGIEWNAPLEAGGFLVGDDVTLNLEIEAALQV